MAYFASWDMVPGGYSVDAPSNVLNALCIRHTGGDEYGRTLPTSIRAFDDYRPPLPIYVLALSSYLHPLTVKSARFLSMGLGWAALRAFLLLRSHFPLPQIRWALFYPLLFTFLLCAPWILVPDRMPEQGIRGAPGKGGSLRYPRWSFVARRSSYSSRRPDSLLASFDLLFGGESQPYF